MKPKSTLPDLPDDPALRICQEVLREAGPFLTPELEEGVLELVRAALAAHPVAMRLAERVRPPEERDQSGERAKDGLEADGDDHTKAGSGGR